MFLFFGTIIFIIVITYAYYQFKYSLTGEPGPFQALTYEDDGRDETYEEIITYLDDPKGPKIILKMQFTHYENPTHLQQFLIQKSLEQHSRIKIEVKL